MGMVGEIGGVDLGFGTSRPFEVVGAGWLEAEKVALRLNDYQLPGVRFSAIKSVVGRGSQKGRTLPAVKVDIINASSAPLTPINLFVIEAIRLAQGRDMMQIQTKAGKKWGLFDKVNGTDATRKDLLNGRSVHQIVRSWSDGVNAFKHARTPYLIY